MSRKERKHPLIHALLLLIILGAVVFVALVGHVAIREWTIPAPDDTDSAVIVLGAQVKEDGTLSRQLKDRLDMAYQHYCLRPRPIVVCGARGYNEPITEAQAMKTYLLSLGVPAQDILMEDTSVNTRENLDNAKAMLPEGTTSVLIVTSDYHVARALALAADAGFDAQGAGSATLPQYWLKNHCREALAWVKYWCQKAGLLPY